MHRSRTLRQEAISMSTPLRLPAVLVAKRHHLLVRWSHWLNIPILVGLTLSGISIYWSSPIYQHKPDPLTGNFDAAADIGIWICGHVPWLHRYNNPPDRIYNHMSLGPSILASALRLHWLCAYAFMLNGAMCVTGSIVGGGWRGLLPRRTDPFEAFRMVRYYIGLPLAKLMRRQWRHRSFNTNTTRSSVPRTSLFPWRVGYPPMPQAKWVRVESSVNLDASGSPDPYFMSLDLATASHPQTLLATH
jgi:hypothetical protein